MIKCIVLIACQNQPKMHTVEIRFNGTYLEGTMLPNLKAGVFLPNGNMIKSLKFYKEHIRLPHGKYIISYSNIFKEPMVKTFECTGSDTLSVEVNLSTYNYQMSEGHYPLKVQQLRPKDTLCLIVGQRDKPHNFNKRIELWAVNSFYYASFFSQKLQRRITIDVTKKMEIFKLFEVELYKINEAYPSCHLNNDMTYTIRITGQEYLAKYNIPSYIWHGASDLWNKLENMH